MVKDFLFADKKIYDSVHGFIPFDEFEKELIDSIPFQRLHYIHQLGIAYLVYPGATHTRFEHSLGVMLLASLMFERFVSLFDLMFFILFLAKVLLSLSTGIKSFEWQLSVTIWATFLFLMWQKRRC